MPILIPRTVTPHLFRQLATSSPRCFHTQTPCRHEAAAADFVQSEANLEQHEDVNGYATPSRERKHGFKALPVSPLMREGNAKRPRRQNAQQHDALKAFQKEVAMNPYGAIIPRPLCPHTILILPSSTSTRNSRPILQSHTGPPASPFPAPFHHNNRKIASCQQ